MGKRIFRYIFFVILIFSLCSGSAYAFTPTNFEISAEGVYLVNLDTDRVIYAKNEEQRLYPASLTKMMTSLLLIENTSDLDNETVTVSANAINSLLGTGSSMGGLRSGEVVTVREMTYVLMMASANEAANAIAEHVGGSIEAFVAMMNARAAELGMTGTHFMNAHGLHDEEHYTTPRDIYLLMREVYKNSFLKEVIGTRRHTAPATNKNSQRLLVTTNMLIDGSTSYYYKYATGGKTGYTDEAGRCLASFAEKDGFTYACVIMNSPVWAPSGYLARFEYGYTEDLFEWAFTDFEYKTVVNQTDVVGEVNVELAWEIDHVTVRPANDYSSLLPKAADTSTVTLDITYTAETIDAPVSAGQILGKADIMYAGEKLGKVDLVATTDIEKNQWLAIWRSVKQFTQGTVFKVIIGVIVAGILAFIIACVVLNSKRRRRRRMRKYRM